MLHSDIGYILFIAHNYDFAINAVHDVRNVVRPTFFYCSDRGICKNEQFIILSPHIMMLDYKTKIDCRKMTIKTFRKYIQ